METKTTIKAADVMPTSEVLAGFAGAIRTVMGEPRFDGASAGIGLLIGMEFALTSRIMARRLVERYFEALPSDMDGACEGHADLIDALLKGLDSELPVEMYGDVTEMLEMARRSDRRAATWEWRAEHVTDMPA